MTDRSIWTGAALVVHLGAGVGLHAVSNAQAVQPPDSVDPAVASPVAPAPPELYSYDSEGRRDPFVSLIARGVELPSVSERPDGLSGLSVNEVALRGVVLSLGTYLAVLEAPDNKTYIVRPDDLLFDGSVKEITAEFIVFMEDVSDPLSLVTEREVRKGLRDAEEGR
jgi:Tfp pilus assembly protein PilP